MMNLNSLPGENQITFYTLHYVEDRIEVQKSMCDGQT